MIDITNLKVARSGQPICTVAELKARQGSRVSIVGPNGSGKTTLLRVIAGLETEYTGQISVSTSKRCGYVQQHPHLFRGTVLSNVAYGLNQFRMRAAERNAKATEWLARFDIESLSHRAVDGLSGGERRRIAIARAMILEPEVLLLDEPFADLDPSGINVVRDVIKAAECCVLIASPSSLPTGLMDQEYVLKSP